MDGMELIRALTPEKPGWAIDWAAVEASPVGDWARQMAETPQNPKYHGEGDVWTHTKLVCEALAGLPEFRRLEERRRQELFWAALLHDIGKIPCTRWEDGRWTSPHHAPTGARMARKLLWTQLDLCGTPEKQAFRETVCALVRWHTLPPHAVDLNDGPRRLRTAASAGELAPDFTLGLLCLLAIADAMGKVAEDREDQLERVELCAVLAGEAGCLKGPYPFPSPHTRVSYLSGGRVPPDRPLYDDAWGEVVMLSGLPGTGKDTWIGEHCPDLPQISLDAIRAELGAPPTGNQGPVVELAHRRAKELLGQKRPFVWNATNVSPALRQKSLNLFHSYGAATRVVYLETGWAEGLRRNKSRAAAVPEDKISDLLDKLEPPTPAEAREVRWLCV